LVRRRQRAAYPGDVDSDIAIIMEIVMKTKKSKITSVRLAKIAASIKMDAKNARARLRRLKIPAGMLASDDAWEFTTRGAEWVRKQLKIDRRKAAA
jgi:hypothetical protein